jgi:hypothetical protein
MAQKEINSNQFTQDIVDFIVSLTNFNVKYVIVGGQAVIYYGHSRLTGDIDFYYERSESNCNQLFLALQSFWEGDIPYINESEELLQKNMIFQFGVPPNRIDLVNEITGMKFNHVWKEREIVNLILPSQSIEIYFIGLNSLIKNKEKIRRPRDLEDLKFLKLLRVV